MWRSFAIGVVLVGLLAGCSSDSPGSSSGGASVVFSDAVVPTGERCPVTQPAAVQPKLTAITSAPDNLFGGGRLWVSVPTVPTSSRNRVTGWIDTKVPWVVRGPGLLRIVGRPIDGRPGRVIGEASAAYSHSSSEPYVLPSSISVSRRGCYEIVGILGRVHLDWILSPRLFR